MTALTIATKAPSLAIINGHATTTSLQVAEYFGKKHFHVLRDIEQLECSPEFRASNFGAMSIDVVIGNGAVRSSPAYRLTKDGFVFLAMGFTGKEAARFKEAYITAFNDMERELANPHRGVQAVQALEATAKLFESVMRATKDTGMSRSERARLASQHAEKATGIALIDGDMPASGGIDIPSLFAKAARSGNVKYPRAMRMTGVVPHSLLLTMSKSPVVEFKEAVQKALEEGCIEVVSGEPWNYGGVCYRLCGHQPRKQ